MWSELKAVMAGVMDKVFPSGFKQEFNGTLKIAWALILTQALDMNFQQIAVMFGGHLGKLELDVIALSNTLINVIGLSMIMGIAVGTETVFSQSFGYGNNKMIGIYLQRCLYLQLLSLLPCIAIHLNIARILVLMGQDPQIAKLTGDYLLYFIPGLLCYCVTIVLRRYTQCQNAVIPHIFIMVGGHIVHAICQYLFLYQFNLGILGSAVALDITYFVILVATYFYTVCSKAHRECWPGWKWHGLLDWGPLGKLCVYGMLMVCFEWWAFEISILLAGTIGPTELAAQSVAFNLDLLYYGVIYGIGIATSIRVGQFVGAGMPSNASTSACVGMTIATAICLIVGTTYITLRYQLPKIFTSDDAIINMVADILPILGVYGFASGINVVGRGVFRGIGWQRAGSVLSFVAFYVFAWPIAIPLTFYTSLSILGIWLGFMVALVISGLFYIIVIYKLNWVKVSEKAVEHAECNRKRNVSKQPTEDLSRSTESSPLLTSQNSSLSSSIMEPKIKQNISREVEVSKAREAVLTGCLILKRAVTVTIFVAILSVGVFVRLMLGASYPTVKNGNVNITIVEGTTSSY